MTHLSLCSSQDDTMPDYPHCDCGEAPPDLTLRDHFAGLAMQAALSATQHEDAADGKSSACSNIHQEASTGDTGALVRYQPTLSNVSIDTGAI